MTICANSITTIYFLLTKFYDKSRVNTAIEYLLDLFDITAVNKFVLQQAQQTNAKDFEDAVIFCSATAVGI
ncbi:PIN domain-containing protein [Psychrobacter sp. I-STPA10]|uniref:PIN domain-containing protein n=1 Tax=Psychrobacter sp. I-STPA10 TaxID=2585769 RepID=UPI002E788334|nr:hypothetical protein [Psychrobacter sp. I-STPA10]